MYLPNSKSDKQAGSALIVSLVILLLLTLIGVTAMSTTSLEERMAGNNRDENIAFQAAETAARDGENWIVWVMNTTLGGAPPYAPHSAARTTLSRRSMLEAPSRQPGRRIEIEP